MRSAQISLTKYFVNEFQFKVSPTFDPQKPYVIGTDDMECSPVATPLTDDRRSWRLLLRIISNAAPERNVPYTFIAEVEGTIIVDQTVTEENIERFVRINGTSVVFGAAREIVRAMTSRGPWGGIFLPTVTFWQPKPVRPTQLVESEKVEREPSVATLVAETPE